MLRRWIALALVAVCVTACGPAEPVAAGRPGQPASRRPPAGVGVTVGVIGSYVATAHVARVAVRDAVNGRVTRRLRNPTGSGAPLTFLVIEKRDGWLEVALPVRPNGSTGWIAAGDAELTVTPYDLIVSRQHHRLDVEKDGRRIARYEIGVGKAATPTPAGRYYVTELIRPPDPHGAYGPYAFGLSAFSETLTSFGGGPGQIGLHGTDTPHGLGHDVSHGCLRVANDVIEELAATVPLGTPVQIT